VHLVYRSDIRVVVRNGIKYELDLSEGIDLSVFLFGNFQKHVSQNKVLKLSEDAVIFDIGANCGTMTLPFSRLVPCGKVYSFEPTHYAFSRLQRNLELNPDLAARVTAIQSFVSSDTSEQTQIKAYASWKVGRAVEGAKHQIHQGIVKSTDGVGAISLDDFCGQSDIERLDFMKIDTDGHEFEVLKGARETIGRFCPMIIFEIGMYVMEEWNINFSDYLRFFDELNYSLVDSGSLKAINAGNDDKRIPLKGTIDILAIPDNSHENN
jgi:FkbM family methyltransferase